MNILFYRYGSICEPDLIAAFREYGITVYESDDEITDKNILPVSYTHLTLPTKLEV